MRSIIATSLLMQTTLSLPASSSLPPKPPLNSLPLPAKLAGGLFLFQTSVTKRDKELSREILLKAQDILRRDPLISMELGTGIIIVPNIFQSMTLALCPRVPPIELELSW